MVSSEWTFTSVAFCCTGKSLFWDWVVARSDCLVRVDQVDCKPLENVKASPFSK